MGEAVAALMTTSSATPGRASVLQFRALFQSKLPPPPSQETVESTRRSSSNSVPGLKDPFHGQAVRPRTRPASLVFRLTNLRQVLTSMGHLFVEKQGNGKELQAHCSLEGDVAVASNGNLPGSHR